MINEYDKQLSESDVIELEFIGWQMTSSIHKPRIAFHLIKKFASINKPIPNDLIPYLNDACDYQINNQGNTVSNDITASNWSDRVLDVELLRKCGGYKAREASEAVIKRDKNTYTMSSLKTIRMGHPSKERAYVNACIENFINDGYTLNDIVKFVLSK